MSPATASPPPDEPGDWRAIPDAPLAGRVGHTAVWTGTDMVVWGGQSGQFPGYFNDGAAYNPGTNEWRTIAEGPLGGREAHSAIWTGSEMVVWGGLSDVASLGDGAAYDPVTDAWREIASSPLDSRAIHRAVWTGREMIVWGGRIVGVGWPQVEAAAYDPVANTWRVLARSPLPSAGGTVVWTGTELIVVAYPDQRFAVAAAYDPASDTWRELAPSPLNSVWGGPAAWTGDDIFLLSHEPWSGVGAMTNVAYNLSTDTWRPASNGPRGGYRVDDSVWAGDEVLIYGYWPVAYHPGSDTWRRLQVPHRPPAREGESVVWSGREIFVWGGTGGGRGDGFARSDGLAFEP